MKNNCLLGNKCNLDNIIYKADISTKENYTNDKAHVDITSLYGNLDITTTYNHLEINIYNSDFPL